MVHGSVTYPAPSQHHILRSLKWSKSHHDYRHSFDPLPQDRCKSNNSSSQPLEEASCSWTQGAGCCLNHHPQRLARGPHRASNACQPRHRGCGLLCACRNQWGWPLMLSHAAGQLPGMRLPAASTKDWPVQGSSSPSYEKFPTLKTL